MTYTNEKLAAGATYTYKIRPVFTAADGESIEGVDSKEAAIALTPAKVKKLKAKASAEAFRSAGRAIKSDRLSGIYEGSCQRI